MARRQQSVVPQQPLNVFAGGGVPIRGKFESQPDLMPKSYPSASPAGEVPVMRHNVVQGYPDAKSPKAFSDVPNVPVSEIGSEMLADRHRPSSQLPDTFTPHSEYDKTGMTSWNPLGQNPSARHPYYNDYDRMPEQAQADDRNPSVPEMEGSPSSQYEGPYRPKEDNGQPYYMNNWDVLARRMKDESAWNDMYSGSGNEVGSDQEPRNSLDELLNGIDAEKKKPEVEFKKDDTKRDGGFFGWLRKNLGTPRKDGESDEDYDRRVTNSTKKMAVLADTLRHLGNLVNTTKGGISQTFNTPVQQLEAEYQQRRAQRAAEDKAKADSAYKQANLQLKQDAAKAQDAYRALSLQLKANADARAAKKADDDANQREKENKRKADNDAFNHDLATKKFNEQQNQNRISNGLRAAGLAISRGRLSIAAAHEAREAAGGGSGGNASFTNIATPSGGLHRKKALDSTEKKQVWLQMKRMGLITKGLENRLNSAVTTQEQGAIINGAIAYAARDPRKKNNAFRQYLKDHHGYSVVNTVKAPQQNKPSVPQKKKGNAVASLGHKKK